MTKKITSNLASLNLTNNVHISLVHLDIYQLFIRCLLSIFIFVLIIILTQCKF